MHSYPIFDNVYAVTMIVPKYKNFKLLSNINKIIFFQKFKWHLLLVYVIIIVTLVKRGGRFEAGQIFMGTWNKK